MANSKTTRYTQEFMDNMVHRMLSEGISASKLSAETGVSISALCRWRKAAETRREDNAPGKATSNGWSSADKFHAVLEAYHLNEQEKAAYCRAQGIYPEQLEEWREACLQANAQQAALHQQLRMELKDEKQSKAAMAKELRRKEKALAEAAALLVLRKKAEAIWGEPEEE